MLEFVVIALFGALALAVRFPAIARWGGVLLILDSVLSLHPALGHGILISTVWLVVGVTVWLFGHLVEAYRIGYWRSWIAMQAFRLPLLRRLRPVFA
ncbi:hypothetical protein ACWEKT_20130 [Nocardia takedensis]|uniref:hypothetical protein n=1 Tax=Nocardia takedensis TaxID=259390 RepID=UPI0002FED650|nr:hypothetical protein [Nocardia takedensis]